MAAPRVNPAAIGRAMKRWETDAIDALCDIAELGDEPAEHVMTDAEMVAMEADLDARGVLTTREEVAEALKAEPDWDAAAAAAAALAPLPDFTLTDDQCHRVAALLLSVPEPGEDL